MTPTAVSACRIHEHLQPREAARVLQLLERISRSVALPTSPSQSSDHSLHCCPYLKIDGPSTLCTDRCHLHHLIFEESWP